MSDGPFSRRRLINSISDLEDAIPTLQPQTSGEVKWVGNTTIIAPSATTTGADSNDGTTRNLRKATLTGASGVQSVCTSGQGDNVLVCAGHAEDVAGAAAMTFSVAGVHYRGLGSGSKRPTLTWKTLTSAQIIISGDNITFENFIFDFTGIDAVVAAISVTGAFVRFINCRFVTNNATAGVVLGILTAATATGIKFLRCEFEGFETNSGTTTTACIKHEVGNGPEISDCTFTGKMTQAILNVTASVLRWRILRCIFHIYTGTAAVTVSTTATGLMADCRMNVASGTAPVAGTALSFSGNRYTTEGNGPTAGTADAF